MVWEGERSHNGADSEGVVGIGSEGEAGIGVECGAAGRGWDLGLGFGRQSVFQLHKLSRPSWTRSGKFLKGHVVQSSGFRHFLVTERIDEQLFCRPFQKPLLSPLALWLQWLVLWGKVSHGQMFPGRFGQAWDWQGQGRLTGTSFSVYGKTPLHFRLSLVFAERIRLTHTD